MYERWGRDHVSVGMRRPSGDYERPIPETRLFRTKPGNIAVCSYFKTDNVFTIVKRKKTFRYKKRIQV